MCREICRYDRTVQLVCLIHQLIHRGLMIPESPLNLVVRTSHVKCTCKAISWWHDLVEEVDHTNPKWIRKDPPCWSKFRGCTDEFSFHLQVMVRKPFLGDIHMSYTVHLIIVPFHHRRNFLVWLPCLQPKSLDDGRFTRMKRKKWVTSNDRAWEDVGGIFLGGYRSGKEGYLSVLQRDHQDQKHGIQLRLESKQRSADGCGNLKELLFPNHQFGYLYWISGVYITRWLSGLGLLPSGLEFDCDTLIHNNRRNYQARFTSTSPLVKYRRV